VVGRCRSFLRGEWEQLYNVPGLLDDRVRVQVVITDDRVRLDATRLVKLGEFKKAVERLKKSMLAPPTEETVQVLRGLHLEPNPTSSTPLRTSLPPLP
jgi:hypothetical protein